MASIQIQPIIIGVGNNILLFGLSSTGSTFLSSIAIEAQFTVFSFVVSGSGCALPLANSVSPYIIANEGINTLLVYPQPSDTINANPAAHNVPPGFVTIFFPPAQTPGNWLAVNFGGGSGGGGGGITAPVQFPTQIITNPGGGLVSNNAYYVYIDITGFSPVNQITLPVRNGQTFLIKDIAMNAGNGGVFAIIPQAGDTIDGMSSLNLTVNGQFFTLVDNGTSWSIVG